MLACTIASKAVAFDEEKSPNSNAIKPQPIVVLSTEYRPLVAAQNIVNRHFKPLLMRAGLPNMRWHDLRHSYATLLLSRGTHPTYVQISLGHASVQLTLDCYSHWMPSMGRNTAEGIDEALG